ncbi:MAG: stage III sporulation protein AE, partial [Clostridiales bacterium]|nr:stage III sporulation protein AE [Clostridiales bacterium]
FEDVMEETIAMMQAVIPAFSMTLIFASAQTTAAVFYQIAVGVIWLVERLLCYLIAPAIHVFAVLQMLNCFTGEKMISRLTDLIRKVIRWSLRALLAGVTGINVIETMIAPSVDNLKKMSVTKALSMIPGLGGVTEAVGSIFLGSAVVIKNGVGVAAMVAILCIVFAPVVKITVLFLLYKIAGAIVQPFAGIQVCGCIDSVSESTGLLLKTLFTGILMFLITIAIVITAVR